MDEATAAELLAVQRQQLLWTRAAAMPSVRRTLVEVLDDARQRQAYELCDGTRTYQEIAATLGVPKGTLAGWTKRWRDLSIAYETAEGRVAHLVSADAIGVPSGNVGGSQTKRGKKTSASGAE